MAQDKQVRVFLWAAPRTMSTALFRAFMNHSNTKAILEPLANAYYYGEERVSRRYAKEPVQQNSTFKDMKCLCEEAYSDYQVVFVKDMAYYLTDKLNSSEFIPENFIHTFIIRSPYKAVKSLYKMSIATDITGWDYFDPHEAGFKELYQMYDLVSSKIQDQTIIIDADDVLQYPSWVLRSYCGKIGLSFESKMLEWPRIDKNHEIFKEWKPWFEGALTSHGFLRPINQRRRRNSSLEYPTEVLDCMDDCDMYYRKMYDKRLRPPAGYNEVEETNTNSTYS